MTREHRVAAGLFVLTLASVFWTYGFFWSGGDPFSDPAVARDSAAFAIALMGILGAHELGHYVVGRRHGIEMSPPYFIPFPMAFGTFGAIIRMRTPPRSRTALLEMGAAGPLAGAVVAFLCLVVGLPGTAPPTPLPPPPPPEEINGLLAAVLGLLDLLLLPLNELMTWLGLVPEVAEGDLPVLIFNNPPVMDLLGVLLLDGPPGRFDTLTPVALAGWVGCLLTAINLVPIGQLDGGHVLGALAPKVAAKASRVLLVVAVAAGVLWTGWAFWAFVLWWMGASVGVSVDPTTSVRRRARVLAGLCVVVFALTFMPRPVELDVLPPELLDVAETDR